MDTMYTDHKNVKENLKLVIKLTAVQLEKTDQKAIKKDIFSKSAIGLMTLAAFAKIFISYT